MAKIDFDTPKTSLKTILKEVDEGKIQLPDFQRGWVWDDEGIRSLLTSIAQGFPVGAIMALKTGGNVNFSPRPIQGVETSCDPERLLLDGQQRITSLYQACFRKKSVRTKNTKKQRINRWYYIDMEKAMEGANREEIIVGVPKDKIITDTLSREVILDLSTREQEYKNMHFPMHAVFDSNKWESGFMKYWKYNEDKNRFWQDFREEILDAFVHYQMPMIVLESTTPKEAVCLVFEKVNTGGKKLTAFELLTAIYAVDAFKLRKDWYGEDRKSGRRGELRVYSKVLKDIQSTDFLQAVSLLHTLELRKKDHLVGKEGKQLRQVSGNRQSILKLPLSAYKKWAGDATRGFMRAAEFLALEKIFKAEDVPYQAQIIPLATILTLLGDEWENDSVRQKLARWYWCGVLGELYGSTTDTRFALDVQEVPSWIEGGEEPRTVADASFVEDRLDTLRTRNSAAYKGISALLMNHGGLDFKSGQPIAHTIFWEQNIDIHHIFPKKWCQKVGNIPRKRFNSVINKTPLSMRTNRIIGGKAPSAYLINLQSKFDIAESRLDEILESHLIDPSLLRADDFEAFMLARREALVLLIEEATGKDVVRNHEPTEEIGEVEEDDDEDEEEAA